MIHHDQYPPPKKEPPKLTVTDFVMIGATTMGVYACMVESSFFNLLLVMLAWRMYEKHRSNDI